MRVFTKIRQALFDNKDLRLEIGQIKMELNSHSKNIELVFQYIDKLIERAKKPVTRKEVGYKRKGQSLPLHPKYRNCRFF